MRYYFKPAAFRDLRKLPRSVQASIVRKLDFYAGFPTPFKFAKAMQGKQFGEYRFRAGDYRIIFDVDVKKHALIILAIGNRKDVYQ